MPDREKVIKHIIDCINAVDGLTNVQWVLAELGILKDALALLKAQESVEPTKPDEDNVVYCGACGSPVGYEVLEPPGMDYIRYNYCPNCGKAVKWE